MKCYYARELITSPHNSVEPLQRTHTRLNVRGEYINTLHEIFMKAIKPLQHSRPLHTVTPIFPHLRHNSASYSQNP